MRPTTFAATALAVISVLGCADEIPTRPLQATAEFDQGPPPLDPTLIALVRQLAAGRNVVPLVRPPRVREPLVKLGRALLFDPILSGNHNISCATCHLPAFATGDGKSLAVGEGGAGDALHKIL